MKNLLLMRHAKSSWKHPGLTDRDRALNRRGRRDAPRMGRLLWEEDLVPQLILSSVALRARQTAEAVAAEAGYDGEILFLEELYGAGPWDCLDVLQTAPDDADPVLIIGHNPGLQDLVELLTDDFERMPTAAIAHLRVLGERWRDLRDDTPAELVQIWRARELS